MNTVLCSPDYSIDTDRLILPIRLLQSSLRLIESVNVNDEGAYCALEAGKEFLTLAVEEIERLIEEPTP